MMHGHVRSRLSGYLEGELPAREKAALEAHLIECAPCAAELRALRRAVELLHSLPPAEPTLDLTAAVLARLREGEGARARGVTARLARGSRTPWVRLAPLALAAGIGAVAWLTPLEDTSRAPVLAGAVAQRAPTAVRPAPRERERKPLEGVIGGPGAPRAVAVSPFPVCFERARRGEPGGPDCAAWDAWFLSLASEDAPRFSREVGRLPKAHQQSLLTRLSALAALSGSAPTLGTTLRGSNDPQSVRMAPRFERHHGSRVSYVTWDGR